MRRLDLPDALILERFRSFSTRVNLPLRPITLVYGANNSGKSALIRALALLGASLEPAPRGAITLPEPAFAKVGPRELAWQGVAADYRWLVGLRWEEAEVREYVATINPSAEGDTPITAIEVLRRGAERWRARRMDDALTDPREDAPLHFEGLIPAAETTSLTDLREQLEALRGRVRWMSGIRPPVPRLISGAPGRGDRFTNGEDVPNLLVEDEALREEVAAFYTRLDPPRSLMRHEVPHLGYSLSMNPEGRPTWRVQLADTGEGMAQVLPVLAYAVLTARHGDILAVEQPENHLHPTAQSQLAEFFCALTQQPTGPRFVLETHSRVFLLAMQRAVAMGLLPAEYVQIVWVDQESSGESTLTVVPLQANGRMGDGWPPSALAEDFRLARELLSASHSSVDVQ